MQSKEESKENPHVSSHLQRSSSVDKDKQQKEAIYKAAAMKRAFIMTFSTEHGKVVLRWLLEQGGFHKSQVGGNPAIGMDVLEGTLYNAARESIYIELRKFLTPDILKDVEYETKQETLE